LPVGASAASVITYVQGNYATPQSAQTSVSLKFNAAQVGGDLNVVVVGWNDSSATVSSVSDSAGNTYQRAVGPTTVGGLLSQSIYYAKNILPAGAGVNTVTVRFSAAAAYPDIRILEYSGADPINPVDVTAAASGNSTTSSSGAAVTTNATDLLFGANTVTSHVTGPGSGFTTRLLTFPDGDIAEDRMVTATGSYAATAPLTAGSWIMQMVAFRTATGGPDTQAPTAPTGVTATAASGTQINLSWTASTDNVGVTGYLIERCQGSGCTTFAQIGTSAVTAFNDTGLTVSTGYSYRVRATDAAGNLSAYSTLASMTTQSPDTQAPTTPANLTATALSGSQINLSWTASTDNVGVTGYLIERCQGSGCATLTQIGTSSSTTFNNTGLTASASYAYRVRATDAAGNLSGYSNVASATTQSPDTQAPTTPANLTATAPSGGQINLSWTASTDNVGVTGYLIERCQGSGCSTFAQIGTSAGTTFSNTGLAASTSYSYRARATDAAGNLSAYSNTVTATTLATVSGLVAAYSFDEGAGTTVTDLSGNGNTGTLSNTQWSNSGKYGNALVFNGSSSRVMINDSASLHLTSGMTLEAWVNPSTVTSAWRDVIYKGGNDNYYLEATSSLGGAPGAGATVGSTDTTIVGTAALGANSWTHLALTYDGTALRLYVNGVQVSSQAITGNILTSATPLQIGSDNVWGQYFAGMIDEVRVYNVALSHAQIQSDMATPVGTGGTPDTQAPTAPSSVTATAASGTQINLSWTASTDNVGVTGYLIERCQGSGCTTFTQIGTSAGTTFSDAGLTASAGYSYRVRATDAAGNLSGYSNVASATTQSPDTQPPTTPANLTTTALSGSQISLSWTASTDNVGVTGYLIERCQGVGCTNFARLFTITGTSYVDTGLIPSTSYTYQVKATDAAGNFSPYSNTATTTTLATVSGLVAAYSFDEGTGTTVTDRSGNGNTGTLSNTSWTNAGKYGNALVFNGTSSRVTINDAPSLRLTSAMTLEAWVNPSTVTSAWRDVIYKGGNDNYYLEGTSSLSGVPGAGATVGSTDATIVGTAALAVNTWTHLALTYDGTALRLYVNGVQVSSQPITGSILTSATPLQIGSDNVFGQYFAGMIDEVRVYNVALSQTQIQSDMATPVGTGGSTPVVSFSATSLNLGSVATGSSSAPKPTILSNIGGAQLSISSIGISGGNAGDFAQTNNCGTGLAPGAGCTINVTFTPTTTGNRISSLILTDNAPGSPHTVSLSGTGTGFVVTPRVAVLTFTQPQQFTASGSVTWSVDGIVGGNASTGLITTAGLYTPPSAVGTHTVTASGAQSASATVYVTNYPGTFTFHNDNLRSGVNSGETILTPTNVNAAQFGKLFSYPIDGWAFASPLYVANVNIPNQGLHNVVIVATEHNSVYAFDADGRSSSPLWQVSFLRTGVTTVPCADVGECGDIPNEIGITSTPVIDQATGTLYLVAKTKEGSSTYVQRLHALDITTGAEKFGGPVVIQASVTGNGTGAVNGNLAFNPLRENQRPALVLNNGVIYAAFSSHGDQTPWHGWVIGYNATTLARTIAWCVSPNGYGGGIWQSGSGPAADASGSIFFTTGNGNFNANTGGTDFGDTLVKLGPTGTVVDYFTPYDQATMEQFNLELSSGGPVLLIDQAGPTPHRLVAAGKTGTVYVVNRDNMGHFQAGSDSQIIQSLPGVLPHGAAEEGNYSAPAFFNNNVYFGAVSDNLRMFRFTNGVLSSGPVSQSAAMYPNRGASFAISANGNSNGLLWAVQDNTPAGGVLRVYDANDLSKELYNTNAAGSRDTLGLATKFSIPLVANGKAFIVTPTQITVYGLLP
jgi:chitodextrinase